MAEEQCQELALFVLRESRSWDASRVEIVAQIADHASIDSFSILDIAKRIAQSMPDLAPEVIVRSLRAKTNRIAASSEPSLHTYDLLLDGEQGWHEIDKLASQAPRAFVERLWPWVADILGRLAEEQHPFLNEYRGHSGLSFSRNPDSGKRNPLTHAIELAIQAFAETEPDAFLEICRRREEYRSPGSTPSSCARSGKDCLVSFEQGVGILAGGPASFRNWRYVRHTQG